VVSKRRNEVAKASLIMNAGGGGGNQMRGGVLVYREVERQRKIRATPSTHNRFGLELLEDSFIHSHSSIL
jgi:hypothetical protein